jgi:hypothetical protein
MTAASSPETVLDVRGLTISFVESDGSLDVLDNLSFQVQGEFLVCLIGPSGGGKKHAPARDWRAAFTQLRSDLLPQQNKGGSLTAWCFRSPT